MMVDVFSSVQCLKNKIVISGNGRMKNFPPRAVIVISSQRRKLDALELERDRLLKKITDFEASIVLDVETTIELREKLEALEFERNSLMKKMVDLEVFAVENTLMIVELRRKLFRQLIFMILMFCCLVAFIAAWVGK
uniref:Uncharacterized protein LOC104223756 n=1 Tax=Nicotiana sylvestris TaxID=4096 RepID=A0A1U7W0K7_NICSY|nr:PREDICTED: uncharacterized protein LOC104223756 [Nicotiana sylvestris]